ncbi:NLR family CARD domain-containing protein 3-like [Hoplias malabaricus]|uniref:NLR family CARD domain-containing protein 3-like n=1 Tax=Hoplias malabaricus TaxID=27720 RepID=UPI003462745F
MDLQNSSDEGGLSNPIVDHIESPEPSGVSVKSDVSMTEPLKMSMGEGEPTCVSQKNASSITEPPEPSRGEGEPSCVSRKSASSMTEPPEISSEGGGPSYATFTNNRVQNSAQLTRRNMSLFEELENKVISLVKKHLKKFAKDLNLECPSCTESEMEEDEDQTSVREGVLKITLTVLRTMNQTDLANKLQSKLAPPCHQRLKSTLREKFQKMNEGIVKPGTPTLLNDIYTELYITEGGSREVNNEHEMRQITIASRRQTTHEKAIKCTDLFKDNPIRTVLTKGMAGIGKTVSVQKFILDWAEGKENQDILFIFPLPFRELNLMMRQKLSLLALLHHFFTDIKELNPSDYYQYKILLIFDGLDECRLPLDFKNNEKVSDVTQSASVDVLLTNLIKGNLLPSALLWITTRPAAVNQLPSELINLVTEVQGFSDPQIEEYFRKRISDHSLTETIISHVKSSRRLYIMCHIPVFCWIAVTVLVEVLGKAETGEIPKTLTEMFTHFLLFQIKHSSQKYQGHSDLDHTQTRQIILALGKLAFQQLEKGNLIFYEDELRECATDDKVILASGVCTQIFKEELGNVFNFVHLSVQEFLAAIYAFICFVSNNSNVLQQQARGLLCSYRKLTMSDFLQSAVDKALESESGHLDLFLCFLLGLSLKSNQTLLQDLLTESGNCSYNTHEIVQYIKQRIRENPSPEKSISLFHCLNELNDDSLVQEVQTYLTREGSSSFSGAKLSPDQWSAVAFVLLNSEKEISEFDLRQYDRSEDCLLRLLPVIKASKNIKLMSCNLTMESCEALCSVLQSTHSSLTEMDLSNNDLQDAGVELLSDGLKSSHCKLEILRLSGCMITDAGCSFLASALKSNPSYLRELDLTYNHPGESGVKLLSDLLRDPLYRLEKLLMEHGGPIRMKRGLKKYACELTLDPNTAHTYLYLSEDNKKVECLRVKQPYPHHQDRFDYFPQVLSVESFSGRCYWEVEFSGSEVAISVSYRGIKRKGDGLDCLLGSNNQSWRLDCSNDRYFVKHDNQEIAVSVPPSSSKRVGVYLDWEEGTLSFYKVSTNTLTHLYTFHTQFTEPLYSGFWVWGNDFSVRVCTKE